MADRLGLGDSVRLLGFYPDVRACFWSADFFVSPTYYDPCSLVVLEALACGLPVLASRIEGNIAVLGEGHPGLFAVENMDEYANKVLRLQRDPSYRQSILDYQVKHSPPVPSVRACAMTLAQYIYKQFRRRPDVGDYVRFGKLNLVVREMRDGQVSKVGIIVRER